jgi:hypothetical protein
VSDAPARDERPGTRPVTLLVASLVVALQGLGMIVFAVLEVANTSSAHVGVAVTTAIFFLVVGAGLLLFARGLARVRSWARGPVVAAELIELLTGYSFVGGNTTLVGVVLAVVAVVVLICVFHPASIRAMAADTT